MLLLEANTTTPTATKAAPETNANTTTTAPPRTTHTTTTTPIYHVLPLLQQGRRTPRRCLPPHCSKSPCHPLRAHALPGPRRRGASPQCPRQEAPVEPHPRASQEGASPGEGYPPSSPAPGVRVRVRRLVVRSPRQVDASMRVHLDWHPLGAVGPLESQMAPSPDVVLVPGLPGRPGHPRPRVAL